MTQPAHWLMLADEDLTMAPKGHSLEQLLYFSPQVHEELKDCRNRLRDPDQFYLPTRYADAVPDLLAAEPSATEARASIADAKALVSRIRDLIGGAS